MQFEVGKKSDVAEVMALHNQYQINSISQADKSDGFITTALSEEKLMQLIEQEQGLHLARDKDNKGKIAGYIMAGSWQYWSAWPIFAHMAAELHKVSYKGIQLSKENSYEYGPVCVAKDYRGTGLLANLFAYSLQVMANRYEVLLTFINKLNQRSYEAHVRKLGLDVLQEFSFNGNHYYEVGCLTRKPL